jgi:hypothetical protein
MQVVVAIARGKVIAFERILANLGQSAKSPTLRVWGRKGIGSTEAQ